MGPGRRSARGERPGPSRRPRRRPGPGARRRSSRRSRPARGRARASSPTPRPHPARSPARDPRPAPPRPRHRRPDRSPGSARPPSSSPLPRYLVALTNYTGGTMSSPTDHQPAAPDSADELAPRLHSAVLHLLRRLAREDRASGQSPARLSALSVLVFGGPRAIGRLARDEGVSAPTTTRLVAGLEADGLVTRTTDPADRR